MSKRIVCIVSTIFVAIIAILMCMLLLSDHEVNANDGILRTSSISIGELAEGEEDPNSYNYYVDAGMFEAHEHQPPPHAIPIYGGYQIYCVQPGGEIRYSDSTLTYDQIQELDGKQYKKSCRREPDQPYKDEYSWPVFWQRGGGKLSPALAYIVSGEPIGEYSLDKQYGMWNMAELGLDGGIMMSSTSGGSSSYDKVAADYAEYDELVRDKGLQPEDQTVLEGEDKVRVKVNTTTGKYTIGPFRINYTNGIYGDTAFSGISEMVVYGYNEAGELVNDNIKVEKIVLEENGSYGSSVEPEYFEPDDTLKIDETEQVYPEPGQGFQIIISDPNEGITPKDPNYITGVYLKIKFKYMLANGEYRLFEGIKYQVKYDIDKINHHEHGKKHKKCWDNLATCWIKEYKQQWVATMDAIRSIYEQEIMIPGGWPPPGQPPEDIPKIKLEMELGGYVWEDGVATKEDKADGVINTTGDNIDKRLKNVKVTLYKEDGTIAELSKDPNEAGISEEDLMHRINPTYTDEEGRYLFQGINPMEKYYVIFEYNGQRYLPTEYLNTGSGQYSSAEEMVNAGLFNTTEWKVTSKGTESASSTIEGVEISREAYDQRFSHITAYPENYPSTNNLGWATNGYNASYSQIDLMGYTLGEDGTYSQTTTQLVDGYLYDELGLETDEFAEGAISKAVREYINANKAFPDENAMKGIYSQIAGGDEDLQRKIQFIEDSYIQAYSGSPKSQEIDLYPVFDEFVINVTDEGIEIDFDPNSNIDGYFDIESEIVDGVEYKALYYGEYYINLGLWRRQEFDATLRKDVYRAALKINGKTVVYKYDKRNATAPGNSDEDPTNKADGQDNQTYWDINVRMSDYDYYYGMGYNREIYDTDYKFNTSGGIMEGHPGEPLEVYITYKVTVRNQSMSTLTQIKQVVDYYDKDYTYKPNLSWITYRENGNNSFAVSEDEYTNMMSQEQSEIDAESTSANQFITSVNAFDVKASEDAERPTTEKDLTDKGYKNLYINGLADKKLASGEYADIYLTFEVNKDGSGKVITDGEDDPKENIAEINGYATYYKDGTQLPNGVTKGSGDIAGLLDRDSNPGNLVSQDLEGEKYEKNFEDDTDRAPGIRIFVDPNAVRKANGTVWEDERTEDVDGALIGDGIRQEKETKVSGVTVDLVEKGRDGKEYVWYTTTTNGEGRYEFNEGYIPGDYIIRFRYGDTDATALSTESKGSTGSNIVSYNGQDFKSTQYQIGLEQSDYTDIDHRYQGYKDTQNQNESGKYNPNKGSPTNDTFGYDIYATDKATEGGNNYSDAKDIWSIRQGVIDYSANNVTNHVAEVLTSPYEVPTYNGTEYSDEEMRDLYDELIDRTKMTAETGIIVVEFEYDRQQTDGLKETENNGENSSKDYYTGDNKYNGNYVLGNIDFGLVERPKAQLEIDKSVANVKVTLANGTILFDINEAANNALWQDHKEYSIDEHMKDGKYDEYYGEDDKHRYSFREEIDKDVSGTDKGLIQLTMDQEIMHGATIQVTYTIKITNVGETDYADDDTKDFYYKGENNGTSIVTTTANQVVDYVQNNLTFDENNEANNGSNKADGWKVINVQDLTNHSDVNQDLVNKKLESGETKKLSAFNTIVHTESYGNDNLQPGAETTRTLILSQLINPENTDDDLTYGNMVEIVKTSNTVGRRMAYSVVGNQDPSLQDASEVDANIAERIVILPPFGEVRIYYILGVVIAAMLIGGIILIRRKVLKGKDKTE